MWHDSLSHVTGVNSDDSSSTVAQLHFTFCGCFFPVRWAEGEAIYLDSGPQLSQQSSHKEETPADKCCNSSLGYIMHDFLHNNFCSQWSQLVLLSSLQFIFSQFLFSCFCSTQPNEISAACIFVSFLIHPRQRHDVLYKDQTNLLSMCRWGSDAQKHYRRHMPAVQMIYILYYVSGWIARSVDISCNFLNAHTLSLE